MLKDEIEKVFDEAIIQSCILNTFSKRLWGAWQVLIGNAGIILLNINPKKFYKPPSPKG